MRSRGEYNRTLEQKYSAARAEQRIRRRTLLISGSSVLMSLMLVITALFLRPAPPDPSPKRVEIYTDGELARDYTDTETINGVLGLLELFREASPDQTALRGETQYIVRITMSDGSKSSRCYIETAKAVAPKEDGTGIQSPQHFAISFTIKDILDLYQ